jgi:4-amino-4-deoxy-L-arabinose transferase-like glycosyltransferase
MTLKAEQSRHRYYIVWLLILAAFVLFYRLGDRDMWTGNESEAACGAWDMLQTGRILVPHFLDKPFVDNRPPGAWWLIAATYKLTGVRNTWTARLPSALAALLCILTVYAMGRRAANARAGFLAALTLLGMLIENQRLDEGRYLSISTLTIATLSPVLILIWIYAAPDQMRLESAFREWGMFVVLASIVTWSWILLRADRRRTSWKIAWTSCVIALTFIVGDIYQRAGNTTLSREFAEKVARTVPDNGRLGAHDVHEALRFHLARPVEPVEVANANKFLENPNHYLIVPDESSLRQIDEKLRRVIVSGYTYRNGQSAYLLQGSQIEDKSRLK